jgi:DNA (cytosine-5)-methyltransferase 1
MCHWDGYRALYEALEKRFGHRLRAQVLDAADFGVPQNRKRLFIFGSKHHHPSEIRPTVRRQRPASIILDPFDKWPAGPLDNGRRAKATMDWVKHAISEIDSGRDFLTVHHGSDKAGGFQTLDRPLQTLTPLDRFGLVRWDGRAPTHRMLQVPKLKRAMGLRRDFLQEHGARRDRIKLLGDCVRPPVI